MEVIISEEGANMSGFRDMFVMAKLSSRKHGAPIIFLVVDTTLEILFPSRVPLLCLPVFLGMGGGGMITLYLKGLA